MFIRAGPIWKRENRVAALVAVAVLVGGVPSAAFGDGGLFANDARTYAGVLVGSARTTVRLTDIDGFANWGHPGSTVAYDDARLVAGVLAGRTFDVAGARFRVEADAMFGKLSAITADLDPTCPDEVAASDVRWVTTLRAGVQETLGPATVFATGGLAAAQVIHSVTDTDYRGTCLERELHLDPDDSFRDSSTEGGWVIGVGVEAPLSDAWTLRLDGSYLDFGSNRYSVNHSGNNSCGPGGEQRPCLYEVDLRLSMVRLAFIYRYGG